MLFVVFLFFVCGFAQNRFYRKSNQEVQTALNILERNKNIMRVEIISKAQAICDTPIHYGDFVSVHYNGTLEDGTWFDSTSLKNEPFVFQIGAKKVIPGWEQGLINKCKGDRILLTVPPHLGYGHRAVGSIPEDSTLIFSIEVVEVIPFLQAQQQFQQNPDEFDY